MPFLLVGMSAALVEGAQGATQDLDIWLGPFEPFDAVDLALAELWA